MEVGFSSYSGADFLAFYAALIVAAIIASVWTPAYLRPDGRMSDVRDAEALAYLAGRHRRFVESVVATLFGRGDLRVESRHIIKSLHAQGETPAEKALLRVVGDISWSAAKSSLDAHANAMRRELERKGLLIAEGERLYHRVMPALPFAFLLLLGAFRWQAGSAQGEPVGYLTMLMLVTLVLGLIRLVKFNPRTRAGEQVLESARTEAQRLRSATPANETGLAVGLFGTAVLVGTPYAPLHAMNKSNAAGGGSSTGDGDGGGGCGGGCGGCGG